VDGALKNTRASPALCLCVQGHDGVRVNILSPGPIDTLAARGIPDFVHLKERVRECTPLKRGISLVDIGAASVFLASDDSAGITGQTLYVDCGASIVGFPT
jgi:enoyl-[acyl-carrier protein] reductase I